MGKLDGKVTIITGAAMGMGKATAELFAKEGAKVVVADWNEEVGNETTEEIKAAGGDALFVQVDVSNEESVENMVKATVDHYGTLDAAINNAAITPDDKPLTETDFDYWDKLMSVDLKGVALCLKYELRQFEKEGKAGSIVNTSSVSGIRPQPANPAYVSAKHAVIGLTKQAAMDYSAKGIRINTVAPGAIDTPMLRGALEQFGFEPDSYAKQLSMLGRFAEASEVAQAHLWLVSEASSYVTGSVINVDGGYTSM